VQYLGCHYDDSAIFIFLEYVPGGSISSVVSKFGALSEPLMKVYARQILQGLRYLHANGIVHRDIKGANLLCDTKGNVKLADFGCSKDITGLVSGDLKTMQVRSFH
jgi:mitogen-activated protein kinase kinase kinase